ncbi:MAG: CRISPR-associated CARF protein Csa3 [Thermosphaera sp.]
MNRKALIATLGFDERHVIKSLIEIGMSDVHKLVLLVPNWNLDERTERAIKIIREIAKYAGLSSDETIVIKKINVLDFWSGIRDVLKTLIDLYLEDVDEFIVSLSGGLRILVIETLLATLLIDKKIADRITIRISIENSKQSVSIKVNTIPICIEIDETDRKVLEAIRKGYNNLNQVALETNLPKSTVWKILQRLSSRNVVRKNGKSKKYVLNELGEVLLRLKQSD